MPCESHVPIRVCIFETWWAVLSTEVDFVTTCVCVCVCASQYYRLLSSVGHECMHVYLSNRVTVCMHVP